MVRVGRDVRAVFTGLGDRPSVAGVLPVARLVIEDYASRSADRVYLVFPRFVNTVVQRPVIQQLLPVQPAPTQQASVGYIYEPEALTLLDTLLPRYVEMELYHALLETVASEQSARMVAMRSATDNASEMIDALTLVMNKARQEGITRELLDIVGGVAALEQA